jgi:predicted PurR-regulated permease PerM
VLAVTFLLVLHGREYSEGGCHWSVAATTVWIAFIIVWQRFEDYIVQPLVYGRVVNVNPLVTIISLLVGAELLGILGVLSAIPSAAAIRIILREWRSAKRPQGSGAGR